MKLLKEITCFAALILGAFQANGQSQGSFIVRGDIDKYYPVQLNDGNFDANRPTEVYLGRSIVHNDQEWRGSLMAKLIYHTTNWGNGAEFIDVDLRQLRYDGVPFNFIAGWKDATANNSQKKILVWLKGGGTTYMYYGNSDISPKVYDGVANPLPYHQENGVDATFKTAPEPYVNAYGLNYKGTAFFDAGGANYIGGNLGIGTFRPTERLEVNGTIRAKEIRVEATNWPDYIFADGYKTMPLDSLERYIQRYKHLPELPAAADIEREGASLGALNKMLLAKIEELTLYLLQQQREINELKARK